MATTCEAQALIEAFISEFPDVHIVRNALDGGEFDEAWLWIFDLASKMKPPISSGLRSRILDHFAKYYDGDYVAEVRAQLEALPRRPSKA